MCEFRFFFGTPRLFFLRAGWAADRYKMWCMLRFWKGVLQGLRCLLCLTWSRQ